MKLEEAFQNIESIPFDPPRELTAGERALLDFLIEPLDCPELTAQVAQAKAVGRCGCGCPSVELSSDAPPVPPNVIARLNRETGREDWLELTAVKPCDYVNGLEVKLHVVFGDVSELEVWGGDENGELITELPTIDVLVRDP